MLTHDTTFPAGLKSDTAGLIGKAGYCYIRIATFRVKKIRSLFDIDD